jgi:propionate CoA-transferase
VEDQGIRETVLGIAQAAKVRPKQGTMAALARWVTKSGTMNSREVDIPGHLVDYVIISPKQYYWRSGASK